MLSENIRPKSCAHTRSIYVSMCGDHALLKNVFIANRLEPEIYYKLNTMKDILSSYFDSFMHLLWKLRSLSDSKAHLMNYTCHLYDTSTYAVSLSTIDNFILSESIFTMDFEQSLVFYFQIISFTFMISV